jgi:hypothetical protein
MRRSLDPKNDLTFKRVFGEHKHLYIPLVNHMLPDEKKEKFMSHAPKSHIFTYVCFIQQIKKK